jgi:hypothetical protein
MPFPSPLGAPPNGPAVQVHGHRSPRLVFFCWRKIETGRRQKFFASEKFSQKRDANTRQLGVFSRLSNGDFHRSPPAQHPPFMALSGLRSTRNATRRNRSFLLISGTFASISAQSDGQLRPMTVEEIA